MTSLFDSVSMMPHGYCLLWQPWLVALHAGPDLLITIAYFAIPFALLRVLALRPDLKAYRGLAWMFAAFILLCGVTHLLGLITLWLPIYGIQGLAKLVTAIVSLTTAVILYRLVPDIAALPAPTELAETNARLREEIEAHKATLRALEKTRNTLESDVAARTEELSRSNQTLESVAREMAHRSRNMLTVVRSLTRQSARRAGTAQELFEAIDGRLQALADATNAVVPGSTSHALSLGQVVEGQLKGYMESFPDRLHIDVEDVALNLEAAQHLGLAFYELATNAVKHGALAHTAGIARLQARRDDTQLRLTWTEEAAGLTPPEDQQGEGTGSTLLDRAVPAQFDGDAHREYVEGRMTYTLTLPVEQIRATERAVAPRPGPQAPDAGAVPA